MDSWTVKMGFPLVRISLENRTVKVRQERFILQSYASNNRTTEDIMQRESISGSSWYIPLTYVTDSQTKAMKIVWLNNSDPRKTKQIISWIFN